MEEDKMKRNLALLKINWISFKKHVVIQFRYLYIYKNEKKIGPITMKSNRFWILFFILFILIFQFWF